MTRLARNIAITLTVIVAVLLALPLMVYIPPVQRWLVDKATVIASEATGMDISIGSVSLRPPLTLSFGDVLVTRPAEPPSHPSPHTPHPQADTIASIGRIDASLALLPLFSLRAELGGLAIGDARLNTLDLISDVQVSGTVGSLGIGASTALLDSGTVDLSRLLLADADLCVLLSDTAAVDTTVSEPPAWLITLREAELTDVACEVHLPGDSVIAAATLASATAAGLRLDLLHELYALTSLRIEESALNYDLPFSAATSASSNSVVPYAATVPQPSLIDFSHLALSDLSLSLDSLAYGYHESHDNPPPFLSLLVRHASFTERCGLRLDDLTATVALDSLGLRLPSLSLRTPGSSLLGSASIDWAALSSPCPADRAIAAELDASLSRHDIAHFHTLRDLPDWPVTIKGEARGTLDAITIGQLTVDLPTIAHAEAHGALSLSPHASRSSSLKLSLQAHNAAVLLSALDIDQSSWRLPPGLRLDGTIGSTGTQYTADLIAREGKAALTVDGFFDTTSEALSADISVSNLNVASYVPSVEATVHGAAITARGQGLNPYDRRTTLEATAIIDSLSYDQWRTDSLTLKATIADGQTKADIAMGSLRGLNISKKSLNIGMAGDVKVETDLRHSHKLSGLLHDFVITDSTGTYHPANLGLLVAARPDTTYIRIQNNDFIVKLDASGPYERLLSQLTTLGDTIAHQAANRIIDQAALKRLLPTMRLYVTSGHDNLPANFVRASRGIDFRDLNADINLSPATGMNGHINLYKLKSGTTLIDTTIVTLRDSDHGLTYQVRVANNRKNPLIFTALMDGHLYEHGARLGVRLFDKDGRQGLRLGTQAAMEQDGVRFTLLPKNPTIAFREFTINDNNFLFLRNDLRLSANLQMEEADGTTIDVYSEDGDSTSLQDLTVSLGRVNLKQLTATAPFLPNIEGVLDGDFHIIMDRQKQISVASAIDVAGMKYEGSAMGDLETEFVYLQNTDDTHSIDGILLRDGQQVASVAGSYINKKVSGGHEYLDGQLDLVNTPLNMANGFITDQIVGLEGFANGTLAMRGPLSSLIVDGSVKLDSASLFSIPYGITMGIDNQPITISHSKLTLNNFKLYASPEQRDRNVLNSTVNFVGKAFGTNRQEADTTAYLTVSGTADFSGDGPAPLDFRIRARELQLVNSRQQAGSLLFGKGFISIAAMLRGNTEKMSVRGRLNVLGNTDLTYLLLDSPLSTDNQMDELVKFTDFSDSTLVAVVQRPVPNGMDLNLTVSIDQGAHIRCGLNADQSNYVDLYGGGDLRLRMSQTEDLALTGRYTISSGTMKYSLPVIPLKTFTIQDGSYVEFTGPMDNPTLNITATEQTRATVGQEEGASRIVTFDCGVVVTKTLSDMGLQFIISSPEDMALQSELQAMTVEQRGKLAVTMLTTGMYLADGNTAGFSMNSALSSFLQSEINNIAGNALSTIDVSLGVDNATDADGNMHTDYSFQFAKRFWNNRLKVQIGGKVSSGQDAQTGQKQSFFDNVSMEYRLSPNSNQYLKLFYKQNVYDWLDGYTSEYGGGYIYKRKMDHWWDMFRLWKPERKK